MGPWNTEDTDKETFLNSRRSGIAKTETFWPWWQPFNRLYFETLSFFLLFLLFPLFATLKRGGGGGVLSGHRPWKSLKKIKIFPWKVWLFCLVFRGEHFLFINITKFKVFLFFCNLTDIKKLKSFKDYDVCTINFFRMGHTLERNLTKLVHVWKEKNPKLNIFISSLFQGKKS